MHKYSLNRFVDTNVQFIDGDRGVNYPSKAELLTSGKCVFLNTGNVTTSGFQFDSVDFISAKKDQQLKKGKSKRGDIIMTTRGTVGNVAFFHEQIPFDDIRINSGMVIVRTDQNEYLPYFLYVFFRSSLFKKQCLTNGSGSAQPQLPIGALKNISVPKIDLKIQKKIISVIEAFDKKIALNNSINAELETMAKFIYDYWFVQFDFPDANGNPYKSSGGKMVYNELLKREIPDGWSSELIGDLLATETNTKKLPNALYQEHGTYPVVDQSKDYICGFTDEIKAVVIADVPRIIFGDHTRILKFVNFDFARGADGTQVLLSKNKNVPQHLFYHSLLKIDLSNYGYARHFKFLKDIGTIVPDRAISDTFEKMAKIYYDKIKLNIFENKKLEKVRDWLLPMLMNGQITIKDGHQS